MIERKKREKPREFVGYMGFIDDRPHKYRSDDYYDGTLHGDWFGSREMARKCYEDVRRVLIVEES